MKKLPDLAEWFKKDLEISMPTGFWVLGGIIVLALFVAAL